MEKDETKKVNVQIVKEQNLQINLLQLFVNVYSLPKWNKDDQREIKQKLLALDQSICQQSSNTSFLKDQILKITNLGDYSKIIKWMKDFVIEQIQKFCSKKAIYKIAYDINNQLLQQNIVNEEDSQIICNSLTIDISLKYQEEEENKLHILAIENLLPKKLQKNISNIKKNLSKGANASFIVTTSDNCQYFVKTFFEDLKSSISQPKKIDCRELFAYIVLDYLGFGPETHFLIQKFSSSKGGITKGNYIVTKDVSTIDVEEKNSIIKKDFLLDGDENNIAEYKQAIIKDENFLVELFTLISLNSILRLRDTFYFNTGNQGIIKNTRVDGSITYKPILIDHLPYTSNGLIKNNYSPGKCLQEQAQIMSDKENISCIQKAILEFEIKNKFTFSMKNQGLTEKVLSKIIQGKKLISIKQAIKDAKQLVLAEIKQNINCFSQEIGIINKIEQIIEAEQMLNIHVSFVKNNLEIFLNNYGYKSQ